jgi:hypothetical protein
VVTWGYVASERNHNPLHFLTISLACLGVLNKHCSEILHGTVLNSVSNDFLSFMVGQSQNSLTLLKVMLFQHCQQAIQVMCIGHRQEAL